MLIRIIGTSPANDDTVNHPSIIFNYQFAITLTLTSRQFHNLPSFPTNRSASFFTHKSPLFIPSFSGINFPRGCCVSHRSSSAVVRLVPIVKNCLPTKQEAHPSSASDRQMNTLSVAVCVSFSLPLCRSTPRVPDSSFIGTRTTASQLCHSNPRRKWGLSSGSKIKNQNAIKLSQVVDGDGTFGGGRWKGFRKKGNGGDDTLSVLGIPAMKNDSGENWAPTGVICAYFCY